MRTKLDEALLKRLSTAPEALRYAAKVLWEDDMPRTAREVMQIARDLEAALPFLPDTEDK